MRIERAVIMILVHLCDAVILNTNSANKSPHWIFTSLSSEKTSELKRYVSNGENNHYE